MYYFRAQAPRAQCYGCNPTRAHKERFKILLEVEQESQTPENSIQKRNLLINFLYFFLFLVHWIPKQSTAYPPTDNQSGLPFQLYSSLELIYGYSDFFFGFLNRFFLDSSLNSSNDSSVNSQLKSCFQISLNSPPMCLNLWALSHAEDMK